MALFIRKLKFSRREKRLYPANNPDITDILPRILITVANHEGLMSSIAESMITAVPKITCTVADNNLNAPIDPNFTFEGDTLYELTERIFNPGSSSLLAKELFSLCSLFMSLPFTNHSYCLNLIKSEITFKLK